MKSSTITLVLLTLTLLTVFDIQGQDRDSRNVIGIKLGLHFNQSQDKVYSPFIYSGNGFGSVGLKYERTTTRGLHSISVDFDNIEVSSVPSATFNSFGTNIERENSEATQFDLSYGYTHEIKSTEKYQLYLGGKVHTKAHVTQYSFLTGEDDGHLYANSIDPWMMMSYRINPKNKIRIDAQFPLFAFVSRPEFAIVDNESIQFDGLGFIFLYKKGEFASVGAYQAINLYFTYIKQLSNAIDFTLGYRFDYMRYKKPESISVLKNNIDIGLVINF